MCRPIDSDNTRTEPEENLEENSEEELEEEQEHDLGFDGSERT